MSQAIASQLFLHPRIKDASTVLLYYSMPDEVDTHELVDMLNERGKTVLLPRVRDEKGMDLIVYTGKDNMKEAGSFHILEPQGEPFTDFGKIEVAIIPGVAFTRNGKRLGRGRGYYDRLLPLLTKAYKIGICFPFQILDDVPVDSYDFPMDEVIDGTSVNQHTSNQTL